MATYSVPGTVLSSGVQRLKSKSKNINQTIPTAKALAQLEGHLLFGGPAQTWALCRAPNPLNPEGLLHLPSVPQEALPPNTWGLPLKYFSTGQFDLTSYLAAAGIKTRWKELSDPESEPWEAACVFTG